MNQDDKEAVRATVMKTGGSGFESRLGSEIFSSNFFFFS
jgi:hypothetical protein